MSEAFKPHARRGWLRRGDRIPPASPTATLASDARRVRAADRAGGGTDIAEWYDCATATPGQEEVIGLGAFGRVLTVLTCGNIDDEPEDDDEGEDELVERWTPRFRS